jgi:hypothetical protein
MMMMTTTITTKITIKQWMGERGRRITDERPTLETTTMTTMTRGSAVVGRGGARKA